jgi:16S rRNA (guanine527-N7)-methyltransferase
VETQTGDVDAGWLGERLTEPAAGFGLSLDGNQVRTLAAYASRVLAWNRRINVTGAASAEELVDTHLVDALALVPHLPEGAFSFIDVGSGAGLPGIVLSILRSDARAILLEPIHKKQALLARVVRELGLEGVRAIPERLEQHLARAPASFDVAVSRATWRVAEWLERARPLVRPGGRILGLAGAEAAELPEGARRVAYTVAGRSRAVVILDG